MNWRGSIRRRQARVALASLPLVVFATIYLAVRSDDPEIALIIGEPWEDMRHRSSAKINTAIPNEISFDMPKSDARLRFIDPQYGFVTPPARFFTIGYVRDVVNGVRMSPQIEPLLIDDAVVVVLDLQEQWVIAGWEPILTDHFPSFVDTPQWRARLRDVSRSSTAYWQAGDKYQVMLGVNRFKDDKRPDEERYLITLELADAWREP